jgi:polysaccharide biosynthesis protein PslH
MRLLVVMSSYPFPPRTGSAIVAYNSLKHLSKKYLIDLVCLRTHEGLNNRSEFVEDLEFVVEKRVPRLIRFLRSILFSLIGAPPSISLYASPSLRKKVKKKISCVAYDAILLFEMSALQYCPPSSYHNLLVNIEDPQSIKLKRLAELPIWSLWQKSKLLVSARLTSFYERRFLPRMAKVLLLSKADISDMSLKLGYKNLGYVPYGVEQQRPNAIPDFNSRHRAIVFSGSMYHAPNIDAALYLLTDIFPLVLKDCPFAVLWIVGADPDVRICKAAKSFGKSVVVTGRVADVSEYVKRATVSICPVGLRIGVQTKILEAMSWGTPVVTTIAGNSGIAGVSGIHLWEEKNACALAKRLCDLLRGRDWHRLSEAGRQFSVDHFSWEISAQYLEDHVACVTTLKDY